jgi:hypothetical protein
VDAFRRAHPETPDSFLARTPGALDGWMQSVALPSGAGLPQHVFVGADGHVRCTRAGAISEADYGAIAELLR